MNDQRKVEVDPLNISFARAMEVVTWAGIAILLVFGLIYMFGAPSFVDMQQAVEHWHEPAGDFWESVSDTSVQGYGWFLTRLTKMDAISMVGICVLGLAPLAAILAALARSLRSRAYLLIFLVLTLEFLFAIVRPLIMGGGGE